MIVSENQEGVYSIPGFRLLPRHAVEDGMGKGQQLAASGSRKIFHGGITTRRSLSFTDVAAWLKYSEPHMSDSSHTLIPIAPGTTLGFLEVNIREYLWTPSRAASLALTGGPGDGAFDGPVAVNSRRIP